MELVREIGSKSWINKSGNKDTAKFGIFLCPVCKKEFTWRKKWEKNWENVIYCSGRCKRNK